MGSLHGLSNGFLKTLNIELELIKMIFDLCLVSIGFLREPLVQHIQEEALIEALLKGYDIVIDNTNLNKKVLDNYRALVIAHGNHAIEFKDFFDTPLSVCIERDKNRDLQVTEKVIRSFYNNYKDKYPLNGN